MALDTWPVGVSLQMQAADYQEQPERSIDSFQPDHGPALENAATLVPTVLITGTVKCESSAVYETFFTFWQTTLYQGLKHFTRSHPRTGVATQEFQFQEFSLASATPSGSYYVRIAMRYFPPVT